MSLERFTLSDSVPHVSPSPAHALGVAIRLPPTAERAQCLYPQPRNGFARGTAWYSTSVMSWYVVSTLQISKNEIFFLLVETPVLVYGYSTSTTLLYAHPPTHPYIQT
jgi:outer membrane protein assembly factor BamB